MKALLVATGLLLATSPVPATVVSTSTVTQSDLTPWTGEAGIRETVAEIMARTPTSSGPTRIREIEAVGPSRRAPARAIRRSPRAQRRSATIPAGGTRYYWAYDRDPNGTFCTSATFNASNAIEIHW